MATLLRLSFVLLLASTSYAIEPPKRIRYLALGDSFTAGTGASPAESYPAKLSAALKKRGATVELKNVAVNGYTTQNVIERELPTLKGFSPTLVTLAIGANDLVRGGTAEDYRSRVKTILKTITTAKVPGSAIVALPQPEWSSAPVAGNFGDRNELKKKIGIFNEILKTEVEAVGGRYLNIEAVLRDQAAKQLFSRDGLHPNAEAYAKWAEHLEAFLYPPAPMQLKP